MLRICPSRPSNTSEPHGPNFTSGEMASFNRSLFIWISWISTLSRLMVGMLLCFSSCRHWLMMLY